MEKEKKEKGKKYYQTILKNGKTYGKLYRTPQSAIRAVGVQNILKLIEIDARLVDQKHID